jgi:hypothetical protein
VRRSIDDDQVPVPPLLEDDLEDLIAAGETPVPVNWAVSVCDDYDDATPRLQLLIEEVGPQRSPFVAHLTPDHARRLRLALASALKEIGEDVGR